MSNIKYFAVDANGVEHTRKSARVYTHAVVYRDQLNERIAQANDKGWIKTDRSNYRYYRNLVEGTHSYSCITEADIEKARKLTDGVSEEEFVIREKNLRVARANAGDYTSWHCAGWCGRLDLAQKLAAKYTDAKILPAQTR